MAPGYNKRKRPERQQTNEDSSNRPSPHRPENLGLAQHNHQNGGSRGGRGGRRPSRQSTANTGAPADAPSNQANSNATGSPVPPPRRETPAVENSRAATPLQPMAISQPPAQEEPTPPAAPYFYEHVTDDRVKAWEDDGKSAVLVEAKQGDSVVLSTVLQELIRSALDKRLEASEAGLMVNRIISDRPETDYMDTTTFFLNTLALLEEADHKNPHLLSFVAATDIDPDLIRQELDIPLLQALPLVRSSFTQMRARKTTNILYRQANFNLLREETEGYAKLITEFSHTASAATNNLHVSPENAFERITALVGSFDLDVGRVLDITLDVSANLLVRSWDFFVKFYRCSFWWPDGGVIDNVNWEDQGFNAFPKWALPAAERPKLDPAAEEERRKAEKAELDAMKASRDVQFWKRVAEENVGMDAFFELGARRIVGYDEVLPILETELQPEYDSKGKEINEHRRKRINENRKYMKETKLLPPPGNSDAAQLLGFKLRFYASDARDSQDVLPDNLIFLAALLIKIGFISLRDLYPHLYPDDSKMSEEKDRLRKEKAEKEARDRPGGGENALTRATALPDDAPTARGLRSDKERSGGNTPKVEKKDEEAKEELPIPTNQKVALLKALLAIGCLPESLYILGRFPWLVDLDTSLPPYLHRIANHMLSKMSKDVRPMSDREGLSVARDELKETTVAADGTVSFKSREPRRTTKWLGIDKFDEKDGHPYRHYYPDWDDNIPVCQDIDDVFTLCNTFLGLLGVKIGQDVELLGTLVRIAKHSLRLDFSQSNQSRWLDLMTRLLVPALSFSKHNPGLASEMFELLTFFPTITRYEIYAMWFKGEVSQWPEMRKAFAHNQAEAKNVLRLVSNESAKQHARSLAKVTMSSPGTVIFDMINLLEIYSNMIPALVECVRFFSPLANDVLSWALIRSLTGSNQSRMQADGMLTSPWLQALANFTALLFQRYSHINLSPILQFLASELRVGNTTDLEVFEQIVAEMGGIQSNLEFNDGQVLAMAGGENLRNQTLKQLKDRRYSQKKEAQRLVKALSGPGLVGQMLIALTQERQMYPYRESSQNKPLKVLGNNLDKIHQVLTQYLEVLKTNLSPEEFEAAVPDLVSLVSRFGLEPRMAFTICRFTILHRLQEHEAKRRREQKQKRAESNGDVEMADDESKPLTNGDDSKDAAEKASTPEEPKDEPPWNPVLEPVITQLSGILPEMAQKVSVPFYTTFWTYSLQEVVNTLTLYQTEFNTIKKQLQAINNDRSDMSSTAVKERDRKKKAILEFSDAIRKEMSSVTAAVTKNKNRISAEKVHYFQPTKDKEEAEAMHLNLLEECFLPRALLSSTDALYSFTMLKLLHDFGTPGYNTMMLLDELMKKERLQSIIFQCTAMEAQHFGRFLCEILSWLGVWHSKEHDYVTQAHGVSGTLPGFKKLKTGELLDYVSFQRVLYNWHTRLNQALQTCFKSGEYMHIRNAITVLRSISDVFPVVNFMGKSMVEHAQAQSLDESMPDLKLAATSLLAPLKRRQGEWKLPAEFRVAESGKAGTKSATPQPGAGTPGLSATAPEFKPGQGALTNGMSKESAAGKEDGEIEDEKQATTKDADEVMNDAPETTASAEGDKKEEAKTATQDSEHAATEASKEAEKIASKPATPASIPSKPPPSDSRSASAQQSSRGGHGLPNRPDSRAPNSRAFPTPPVERQSGRYPSRADEKYGRLDRPSSRDHSPSGRSRARTPERDPYYSSFAAVQSGQHRDDRRPARPPPQDARYPRDDPYRRDQPAQAGPHARPYDSRDRTNGSMGPPGQGMHSERSNYGSSASHHNPRSAPSSSQVPPATQSQDPHHVNPARLAMINDDPAGPRDRPRELTGPPKDTRRERDDRGPPPDSRDRGSADESQARNMPADNAPSGPRRGRPSRDLTAQGLAESSYGRLNGPASDVPSGPRGANGPSGRGGRSYAAPHPTRSNESPLPSPSTSRPPESPAAFRGSNQRPSNERHNSGQPFERQPSSNSLPTTPSNENGSSVHPSRMGQVSMQPAPLQTNVTANGPRGTASPTSGPPSGPRGAGRAPTGPSTGPSNAAPPSGPASATERQHRNRQRADINATLQGANAPAANGQGVSFRGAAQNRQPNPAIPSAAATDAVQSVASPMDPPTRRHEPHAGRQEPPPNRPSSRGGELFQQKSDRGNEGGSRSVSRRREDERPRGSRNPSRERRPDDNPPMDDRRDRRRPRDEREGYEVSGREMRSSDRGYRQDDGPPRRPPAQETQPSYSGPPPDWDRGNDRRGPRGGGRPGSRQEEYGRPPRREEERRIPAPREDMSVQAGRKRRHEEGPGPGFDESKRRRSGR